MALIDQIISKFQTIPIDGSGNLILTPQDFELDFIDALFSKVLKVESIGFSNATKTPGTDNVIVSGQANLLDYENLSLSILFAVQNEEVIATVTGTFDPLKTATLPVISWINIKNIQLITSISSTFEIVNFGFGVDLIIETSRNTIPVHIQSHPNEEWKLDVADGIEEGISTSDLIGLLGGQALEDLLPVDLVSALSGLKINGVKSIFNPIENTVSYFSTGISIASGWDISPKVALKPGLQVNLKLINPTDTENKQFSSAVIGTFDLNGTEMPIYAGVRGGSGIPMMWAFGLQPGASVTLPSFSDLLSLAGDQDFLDSLPDGLHRIPEININELMVQFDSGNKVLTNLSFEVETDSSWPVVQDYFEIESLSIAFEISDLTLPASREVMGNLYGLFKIEDVYLMCSIQKTIENPDWTITAGIAPGTNIDFTKIVSGLFKDEISVPDNIPEIAFSILDISVVPATKVFSFEAQSLDPWHITDTFSIDNFALSFTRDPSNVDAPISGYVNCNMVVENLNIDLTASLGKVSSGGWKFEGQTGPGQNILIGNLITDLAEKFGEIDLPQAIESLTVSDIKVSFNTESKDFSFSFQGHLTDPITADALIILQLNKNDADQYEKLFSGQLTIGDAPNQRIFDLIFDSTPGSNILLASYQTPGGDNLSLSDLLQEVLPDAAEIPDLELSLKDALLVLDKEATAKKYLFTADVDLDLDFSILENLPIVGTQFQGADKLSLGLQPILSKVSPVEGQSAGTDIGQSFTPDEVAKISGLLPEGTATLPVEGIAAGFGLITTISWGEFNKIVSLGASANTTADAPDGGGEEGGGEESDNASETGEGASEKLDKSLGALNLSRLNLKYKNGAIVLQLDADLKVGPLELALIGLGASYNLKEKSFGVSLDGMAMSFKKPPLEISGGFMKIEKDDLPPDYVGKIKVQTASFGLIALGAFSEINHKPSFFLYIAIDYPLGGPVFFFVEGLAFGFGYNRLLTAPDIALIRDFPLVSEVIGRTDPPQIDASLAPASGDGGGASNLATALRSEFELLSEYIRPKEDQYFVAVGLKFNSFKIVHCFGLLIINFGEVLDFTLIGIGSVTYPIIQVNPEQPIMAQLEIALKATYKPAEGFIGIDGILTDQSFVLSRKCLLEGRLSYYSWVSGKHEGDFVFSLGGYYPNFQVPAHYPQPANMPRLGFNWKYSDLLSFKGGIYFAITPKAMMLGAALEATFKEETDWLDINASFNANADLLIYWEPFHYQGDVSIEISASIVIKTEVKNFSADLSASAGLEFWGPPFMGVAHIKAKVLGFKVKFEIELGEDQKETPKKIDWSKFKNSFLPDTPEVNALTCVLSNGLIKTVKDDSGNEVWIINPKDLKITVSSLVPVADGVVVNSVKGKENYVPFGNSYRVVETAAYLDSSISIDIKKEGDDKKQDFTFSDINKKYPRSLWSDHEIPGQEPDINSEQLIKLFAGQFITVKKPPKAGTSYFYKVEELNYDITEKDLTDKASFVLNYAKDTSTTDILKDLANTEAKRNDLMRELGLLPETDIQLNPELLKESFVIEPILVNIAV